MKLVILSVALVGLLAFAPNVLADKTTATKAVAEARAMVRSAERSGADSMATADLKLARDLLVSAQASMEDRKWQDAEYAAEKSQRNAEVADLRSQALKAEAALAELQAVVDTLRNELQRKGESS